MRRSVIGIDIGGTNMRAALVDVRGSIITQEKAPTEIHLGASSFLERLRGTVGRLQAHAAAEGCEVAALGAGVPGLISNTGYVHSSVNMKALDGRNLRDEISKFIDVPVAVVNDVNAFACGEHRFGAGRGYSSFLMLTLGTGVGGGLVLDGKLWSGVDGCAGEYGHSTVEPEGYPCNCGNLGCLEQYASATAIAAEACRRVGRGDAGLLSSVPDGEITAHAVAEAARAGDPMALEVFAAAGKYLGIAAATVANLLNLEALVISGGVAESFDLLEPYIRRELATRAFPLAARRMELLKGELGDNAGLLGSAAIAMALVSEQ